MTAESHAIAARVAALLIEKRQSVAVAESSAGGLIAARLLAVPGASAYFLGGGVIYTATAREALLGITPADMNGMRASTEPYARMLADRVRAKLGADWGLAETGASGPTGNRYGDAAGHCCLGVSGANSLVRTLESGSADRAANMETFATAALLLLAEALEA
jgi:PncC family amidohydrolase